jgi:hypothetical protein
MNLGSLGSVFNTEAKKTLTAPIVLGCRRGAGFGFSDTRVPELDLGSIIVDCICGSHGTTKFSMIGPYGCEFR